MKMGINRITAIQINPLTLTIVPCIVIPRGILMLTISSIIRKKQYQIDRLNPVSKNFCINDSLLAKTLTEFLIFHISFFISKLKNIQTSYDIFFKRCCLDFERIAVCIGEIFLSPYIPP